jgi:membrane protein DedA with SNARE-associated domain
MEEFITTFVEWVTALPAWQIYAMFVFVAYIENVVPPVPGDVLVAFGGYLAAEGAVDAAALLACTTAASSAGFMSAYGFGAWWGYLLTDPSSSFWLKRYVPVSVIERGRRWMQAWGMAVVLANRFLAGTRSVIALSAGMSHTKPTSTLVASTVSSLLWNGLLIAAGWVVKSNWHVVGGYLNTYGTVVLTILLVAITARLAWVRWRSGSR